MDKTRLIKILLIIVVILGASGLSYQLGRIAAGAPSLGSNTYQAGWEAAKAKLKTWGFLPPEPEVLNTIYGTITGINGNTIALKADPTVRNPLEDQAPETRTITVTDQTKISQQEAKTPEELKKDQAAFQEALKKGQPPTPITPFNLIEIKLSDLKVNDRISVTSADNIKLSATITATTINLVSTGLAAPLTLPPTTPPATK